MKAFLITTIHNQETRWEYIKAHLKGFGIEFTPILAPDHKMFMHVDGATESRAKHQSLTLAYYQIAQTAIFNNMPEYMICEDDVNISDIDNLLLIIQNCIHYGVPFCYLTQTEHNRQAAKTEPFNELLCRIISNQWETPITFWSLNFAKYFNQYISEKLDKELWLGNIDHELVKINDTGKFNFYGATSNTANGLSSARHLEAAKQINFEGAISEA